MTNEKVIERIENLDNCYNRLSDKDRTALDIAIAALKCVADVENYLTDPDVTWRDISDDCITGIMMKHGFMK